MARGLHLNLRHRSLRNTLRKNICGMYVHVREGYFTRNVAISLSEITTFCVVEVAIMFLQ